LKDLQKELLRHSYNSFQEQHETHQSPSQWSHNTFVTFGSIEQRTIVDSAEGVGSRDSEGMFPVVILVRF
jgi:hypothetical protein